MIAQFVISGQSGDSPWSKQQQYNGVASDGAESPQIGWLHAFLIKFPDSFIRLPRRCLSALERLISLSPYLRHSYLAVLQPTIVHPPLGEVSARRTNSFAHIEAIL